MKFYKALNILYYNPKLKIINPDWHKDSYIGIEVNDDLYMVVGPAGYEDFDIEDMNKDNFEVVE